MRYRRQVTMFTMMFLLLPSCVTPRRNGVPEAINITRSHRAPDENAVVEVVKAVVEPAGRVAEALADVTSPLANGIGDAFRALGRGVGGTFPVLGAADSAVSYTHLYGYKTINLGEAETEVGESKAKHQNATGGDGDQRTELGTAENAATE